MFDGAGVKRGAARGWALLKDAAAAGSAAAMFAASLRRAREGRERESLAWLRRAAAAGHPKASFNLALRLLRDADADEAAPAHSGAGGEAAARAEALLRAAAAQGHGKAAALLAELGGGQAQAGATVS